MWTSTQHWVSLQICGPLHISGITTDMWTSIHHWVSLQICGPLYIIGYHYRYVDLYTSLGITTDMWTSIHHWVSLQICGPLYIIGYHYRYVDLYTSVVSLQICGPLHISGITTDMWTSTHQWYHYRYVDLYTSLGITTDTCMWTSIHHWVSLQIHVCGPLLHKRMHTRITCAYTYHLKVEPCQSPQKAVVTALQGRCLVSKQGCYHQGLALYPW